LAWSDSLSAGLDSPALSCPRNRGHSDDATRLAYAELLPDERGETVAAFLTRAVAWYALQGVAIAAVMTDNGAGYRPSAHTGACRLLGLRHLRTRPYRPRTNGKAERFASGIKASAA